MKRKKKTLSQFTDISVVVVVVVVVGVYNAAAYPRVPTSLASSDETLLKNASFGKKKKVLNRIWNLWEKNNNMF